MAGKGKRLTAAEATIDRDKMHPGMTTILTGAPLHPDTRTGKDFVIMS